MSRLRAVVDYFLGVGKTASPRRLMGDAPPAVTLIRTGVGGFTDYVNNRKLDMFFGGQPWTPPATFYAGLTLFTPSRSGVVVEPPASFGYARVAYPNGGPWTRDPDGWFRNGAWERGPDGWTRNLRPITFRTPSGPWGRIMGGFMADAPTGGNVWLFAPCLLTLDATASLGGPVGFAAGAFMATDT